MSIFKKKDNNYVEVDVNSKADCFEPTEEYMHLLSCSCCNRENTFCPFCVHSKNNKRRV
jgi:hypothetical protein